MNYPRFLKLGLRKFDNDTPILFSSALLMSMDVLQAKKTTLLIDCQFQRSCCRSLCANPIAEMILVIFTPSSQSHDYGKRGFANVSQKIFHLRRQLGEDLLGNQTVLFELVQLHIQHPSGSARDHLLQFAGPLISFANKVEKMHFPLSQQYLFGKF
jgi:hypothetical protein